MLSVSEVEEKTGNRETVCMVQDPEVEFKLKLKITFPSMVYIATFVFLTLTID